MRGGGDCSPALSVPPALQKSNEIGEYGRVKTLSSSTIIYNKQAKPWSHRRPAVGCGGGLRRRVAAAAASVAWPQAEAIESSDSRGQAKGRKSGGKRRKKKRGANRRCSLPSEPWMALLLLLYYTWIVVWFSKIVEF